jgi:ABC-2 type transport system permease protein
MLQAPMDVLVERGDLAASAGLVAGQLAWAVALMAACRLVQRVAERKLVIQGG